MSGPLLVIAHEATRTGSPRVLLDLLRYAGPRLGVPLSVQTLAGGPLEGELRGLSADVDPADRPIAVLVNGAAAAGELWRVDAGVPTAVYVHEQGDALRVLPARAREAIVDRAEVVLCVSDGSHRDLLELGAASERLVLMPPVVSSRPLPTVAAIDAARQIVGAPPRSALVVGCGEAGWRKGADLFVDVARRVVEGRRCDDRGSVAFAWLGNRPRAFGKILDHDTRFVGVADCLRWVGEVDDPSPFLAAADVLVMPSREDPQPLVPLEAALVGTPTAAFAVGGLVDLGRDGAAVVEPFPDTAALARCVLSLLDDPDARDELASAARRRVAERQALEVVGPRFVEVLTRLIGRSIT